MDRCLTHIGREGAAPGIINPRLIRLRCLPSISEQYLVEAMRSIVTFQQLAFLSRGGTMEVINIGTLNEVILALPPINEQNEIVASVRQASARFDELYQKADRAVALLHERRAALITAAVTGQIDVRGLPPAEAA